MSGIVVTLFMFALTYTICAAQDEAVCGRNEVYRSCGSACPPTCRNYNSTGTQCIALCVKGCFCKSGWVRDERTRRCVRPYQCPIQ